MLIGRLTGASRKDAKERASELLARFRLTDAASRAVKTYSGGMRRRLDLAASLVPRPRVLFLDEPTTGLDPRSRNELWDIVRDLVDEGVTVLLTTQYLEEADQLADQIAVIDHGRVIAQGTSAELKALTGADTLDEVFLSLTGHDIKEAKHEEDDLRRSPHERHHHAADRPPAARQGRPAASRTADLLARLAHAGAGQAQPVRADGLLRSADHVPAAVRVRLRRRGQRVPARVPAVRAARHHRAELAVHDHEHRGRPVHRPGQGVLEPGVRALPIARFAPLGGRIIADVAKQAWAVALLFAVGTAMGFRAETSALAVLAAGGLVLVFTLAFAWALVWVGMLVGNPEKVQIFGFVVLFPLTFTSGAFVRTATMPGWLQAFSKANPVTLLADATRALMIGGQVAVPAVESLLYAAGFVAVFGPLAVRAFRRRG